MHKVFVYGTLKSGHGNNRLLHTSNFLGRCVVMLPFRFVSLGGFPGLVRTRQEANVLIGEEVEQVERPIGGEVWEVDDVALGRLDRLEGHPNFYTRQEIETPLGRAWTYTLPPDYSNYREVTTPFWEQSDEEDGWLASGGAA